MQMNPNSAEAWDRLWRAEGLDTWRKSTMQAVYDRINTLVPRGAHVIDIGGGLGILGHLLAESGRKVEVWDISPVAVKMAKEQGLSGRVVDLEGKSLPEIPKGTVVIATEVLEHLHEEARARIVTAAAKTGAPAFFSVPNDRLGPEEEPQHTRAFTAMEFKTYLQRTFKDVRVEVLGPPAHPHNCPAFLLGVCGVPKASSLSVTLPVRDEAADLGRVLASFRGAADEVIIGVDPRTKDDTFGVASKYADQVFYLEDPEGPVPGKTYTGVRCAKMAADGTQRMPEGGVHFAWVRNQCLDKCSSEWVFMLSLIHI